MTDSGCLRVVTVLFFFGLLAVSCNANIYNETVVENESFKPIFSGLSEENSSSLVSGNINNSFTTLPIQEAVQPDSTTEILSQMDPTLAPVLTTSSESAISINFGEILNGTITNKGGIHVDPTDHRLSVADEALRYGPRLRRAT